MNVKWMLRQNHLGKPLLWASFSVIHFSATQQGRQRIEISDFRGGFLSPTPSSLLLCLASACQTLFPQLSFIPISTWPVTTPHAGLLTNSMSWCSHTCPTPVWCWVKRLLNFGSDDPGKEQNTFRAQMHLLCAFADPQSQLSESEGLIWVLSASEWLHVPYGPDSTALIVQLSENHPISALSSLSQTWVFTA